MDGRLKRRQLSMFDPVFDRLLLQILPKDVSYGEFVDMYECQNKS